VSLLEILRALKVVRLEVRFEGVKCCLIVGFSKGGAATSFSANLAVFDKLSICDYQIFQDWHYIPWN